MIVALKTAPPETEAPATAEALGPSVRGPGEFGGLVRKLFKGVKYASWGMIAVSGLVITREVKGIFDSAWDVHPVLGSALLSRSIDA